MHNPVMLDTRELRDISRDFETAPAEAIVRWAVDTFGDRLCLSASMTDAVLIDVATRVEPSIEIVFLDTQYHFAETLDTLERVRRRYGANLRVMTPADPPPDGLWRTDPDACCAARKVAPLDEALAGKEAWMSGLRRADGPTRQATPIVVRDLRGLVKVNPLANWTDEQVEDYIARYDVPVNPLLSQGYPSIGCWPCTRQADGTGDARSGRWTGLAKTECGLHL